MNNVHNGSLKNVPVYGKNNEPNEKRNVVTKLIALDFVISTRTK